MTRRYARARRGERAIGTAPAAYGGNWTLVLGLRLTGVVAPLLFRDAIDRMIWDGYVEKCLSAEVQPRDVVVFDRLSAHLSAKAFAAIRTRGAAVDLLPAYSPDLTPVERCGSKVKTAMRAAAVREGSELVEAAASALRAVSPSDAAGWFSASGFRL